MDTFLTICRYSFCRIGWHMFVVCFTLCAVLFFAFSISLCSSLLLGIYLFTFFFWCESGEHRLCICVPKDFTWICAIYPLKLIIIIEEFVTFYPKNICLSFYLSFEVRSGGTADTIHATSIESTHQTQNTHFRKHWCMPKEYCDWKTLFRKQCLVTSHRLMTITGRKNKLPTSTINIHQWDERESMAFGLFVTTRSIFNFQMKKSMLHIYRLNYIIVSWMDNN